MNVLVDARKIRDFGIGSYVRGLVGAMARLRPGSTFLLLGGPEGPPPELARDNVEWIEERSPTYGLAELLKPSLHARRLGVDLFHSPHYTFPYALPCPGVVTVHDCIHLRFPDQLPRPLGFLPRRLSSIYARRVMSHAVRAARRVLAVSTATAVDLERLLGADSGKIEVVPNGCDLTFRRPATPEELAAADGLVSPGAPFILFAGNPKPHKNLPRLLAAFARIEVPPGAGELPRLVLAGTSPGELGAPIPADVSDRVHAVGRVGGDALRGLYARARVVAVPSLYEGFGLPALEAMAAGVPVIAAWAGGLPEVVGDAGLLVDPRDIEAIATALERGLWEEELRRKLVEKASARAETMTWSAAARKTLAAYEVALGQDR